MGHNIVPYAYGISHTRMGQYTHMGQNTPKTWMTLEILECSIERVKHALNDGEFSQAFYKSDNSECPDFIGTTLLMFTRI